jgi:hypothetical protein
MNDAADNAKKKIRKLLSIAADDAASEHEIQNAVSHARKMMAEYHLTDDDLATGPEDQERDAENAPKDRADCWIGSKAYTWETILAHFVSALCGCPWYETAKRLKKTAAGIVARDGAGREIRAKSVVFYGIAEDVRIARETYDELRIAVIALARLKWGGCFRGDGAAYAEGFCRGLQDQLDRENAETKRVAVSTGDSRALVLIERRGALIRRKADIARRWLRTEHGINLRTTSGRGGSNGSGDARADGRADGRRYNTSAARRLKIC